MKPRIGLLFLCLCWSFLTRGDSRLESDIQAGQDLLFNNPQKGIAYFESLLERYPNPPDSTRGYIESHIGSGYAMCGNLDSARIHLLSAVALIPDGQLRIYALKNLASIYRMQKEYFAADSIFKSTLHSLPESKSYFNARAMLLGENSSVFSDQGQNRTAIQLLKQGLQLCQQSQHPDTFTLCVLRNKLAAIYMNTDNPSMAARELEQVVTLTDPATNLYNYCTTTSTLSRALMQSGESARALPWLDVSLNAARKLENEELEGFALMLFGKYFASVNQQEKAIAYFDTAFVILKSVTSDYLADCATDYLEFLSKEKMYARGLTILCDSVLLSLEKNVTAPDLLKLKRAALPVILHTSSPEIALQTYADLLPLMDSVSRMLLDQSLIDSKAEFQLQEQEQKRKQLEQQYRILAQNIELRNTQIISGVIALVALLFLVLYLVLRYRNKSLLQQRELDRTKQEVEMREQRLRLESQLRTMREKVIQQQKTDLLSQVEEISKLKTELEKAADESHKSAEEAFARQLSETKNKIGLEQFLQQFNAIYPTFFSRLSKDYPSLSTADLQFCALLRLNLSIKDISSILAIEPKSTYKKKYRIEEKMGLQPGEHLERVLMGVQEG